MHILYGVHIQREISPQLYCDITEIQEVQKIATKLIISLKKIQYKERLRRLNLPTLKYRRVRGDMTEVFKIINNINMMHHQY